MVPAREGQVRGAARGLTTLGPTRGPAGSWRCELRGGAGSLADALPRARLTAGQGGRRCSGGEPAKGGRRGTARGLAASLGPRAGWEPALREEARDRSRTRLLHLGRGPAPGRRCGRVCRRGLAPRRQTGGRSRTRCLTRPAGRLGAGSTGGKEKGWPVVGALPFPREFQVRRGAARSRALGKVWSRATRFALAPIFPGESEWKGLTSKGCRQHLSGRSRRR